VSAARARRTRSGDTAPTTGESDSRIEAIEASLAVKRARLDIQITPTIHTLENSINEETRWTSDPWSARIRGFARARTRISFFCIPRENTRAPRLLNPLLRGANVEQTRIMPTLAARAARATRRHATMLALGSACAAALVAACSDTPRAMMNRAPGGYGPSAMADAGAMATMDAGESQGGGPSGSGGGTRNNDSGAPPVGVGGGPDAGGGTSPIANPSGLDAFQSSFYAFARASCAQCHSDKTAGGAPSQSPLFAESDVNLAYINAKPFADFTNPSDSLLVQYAGNNHCGLSNCTSGSAAALAALVVWARAEAGATPPPVARAPVSDLQALQIVEADIQAQPAANRASLRYFTLEAWGNTGGKPPLVTTDMERAALIKMINLLSTGRQIVQPVPVDTSMLVYRVDMRDLRWTAAAWTNLKATDPYFAPANFPTTVATAAAQSLRSDWFVNAIPNSSVNAYFVFLGINSDDPTIDAMNGVNRFADMTKGAPATLRAGLAISRPEAHNRILSWHQTTALGSGALGAGHLFKSYNFDSDVGTSDIFSHPYKPTTNAPSTPGNYDFTYADSDNMFTLPNGLFGYYTVEGASQGQVMNQANAGAPFPGPTFCFQCHDNKTNLFPLTDRVHDAISSAPAGTFPAALTALLLGVYDTQALSTKLTSAGTLFAQAYAALKLPVTEVPGVSTESLNIVTNNYSIVLGVESAAAEMGVTPAQLVTAIKGSAAVSLAVSSLITTDSGGTPNGIIRRDTWEASYAAVRSLLFAQLPKAH
jgi:hypothetical protein